MDSVEGDMFVHPGGLPPHRIPRDPLRARAGEIFLTLLMVLLTGWQTSGTVTYFILVLAFPEAFLFYCFG